MFNQSHHTNTGVFLGAVAMYSQIEVRCLACMFSELGEATRMWVPHAFRCMHVQVQQSHL